MYACIWQNGVQTQIGPLGISSIAYAINRNGQAAGAARFQSDAQHAALFSNGQTIDLGVLSGYVSARPTASTTGARLWETSRKPLAALLRSSGRTE